MKNFALCTRSSFDANRILAKLTLLALMHIPPLTHSNPNPLYDMHFAQALHLKLSYHLKTFTFLQSGKICATNPYVWLEKLTMKNFALCTRSSFDANRIGGCTFLSYNVNKPLTSKSKSVPSMSSLDISMFICNGLI